jgi:hypothetical protein
MSIDIFWRIPTHGEPSSHRSRTPFRGDWFPGNDGQRQLGLSGGGDDGFTYIDYLGEIARAAEISCNARPAAAPCTTSLPVAADRSNYGGAIPFPMMAATLAPRNSSTYYAVSGMAAHFPTRAGFIG